MQPAATTRVDWRKYGPLLLLSFTLVAITPINTDISYGHMFLMGTALGLAVAIPYFFSAYVFKDNVIHFPFRHGRRWYRSEIFYIGVTAAIAYLALPFYLKSTGAWHNWQVIPNPSHVIRLFIGTFLLGTWDELFFVTTVLTVFRRWIPFWYANIAQAVLWVIFLYVLGFRGWGPFALFPFCLSQGFIFRNTKSLFYVLSIHLTLDFILFLALLHAHFASWVPIFITG